MQLLWFCGNVVIPLEGDRTAMVMEMWQSDGSCCNTLVITPFCTKEAVRVNKKKWWIMISCSDYHDYDNWDFDSVVTIVVVK